MDEADRIYIFFYNSILYPCFKIIFWIIPVQLTEHSETIGWLQSRYFITIFRQTFSPFCFVVIVIFWSSSFSRYKILSNSLISMDFFARKCWNFRKMDSFSQRLLHFHCQKNHFPYKNIEKLKLNKNLFKRFNFHFLGRILTNR